MSGEGRSRLRSPWTWAVLTLVVAAAMTFLSLWEVPGTYAPDPADPDNVQTQFTHTGWVLASTLLALPIALVVHKHRPAGRVALLGCSLLMLLRAGIEIRRYQESGLADGVEILSLFLALTQIAIFVIVGSVTEEPSAEPDPDSESDEVDVTD